MGSQHPIEKETRVEYSKNSKVISEMEEFLLCDELTKDQEKRLKEMFTNLINSTIRKTDPNDLYLLLLASKKAYQKMSFPRWKEIASEAIKITGTAKTPEEWTADRCIEFAETIVEIKFHDKNTAKESLIEAILEGEVILEKGSKKERQKEIKKDE